MVPVLFISAFIYSFPFFISALHSLLAVVKNVTNYCSRSIKDLKTSDHMKSETLRLKKCINKNPCAVYHIELGCGWEYVARVLTAY